MDYQTILYETKGPVAVVTLNRPKAFNALDDVLFNELIALMHQIENDPAVRVVVFTGAGKAFCAGGDINVLAGASPAQFHAFIEKAGQTAIMLAELNKPVIAAVNGAAAGAGMNVALAADIILAAPNASFCEAFGNIGLVPDMGGTYLLPRIVGRQKAKELIFTCKTIGAEEAKELGIVNQIVPLETLMDQALSLAEQCAQWPTAAVAMSKRMINRSF